MEQHERVVYGCRHRYGHCSLVCREGGRKFARTRRRLARSGSRQVQRVANRYFERAGQDEVIGHGSWRWRRSQGLRRASSTHRVGPHARRRARGREVIAECSARLVANASPTSCGRARSTTWWSGSCARLDTRSGRSAASCAPSPGAAKSVTRFGDRGGRRLAATRRARVTERPHSRSPARGEAEPRKRRSLATRCARSLSWPPKRAARR